MSVCEEFSCEYGTVRYFYSGEGIGVAEAYLRDCTVLRRGWGFLSIFTCDELVEEIRVVPGGVYVVRCGRIYRVSMFRRRGRKLSPISVGDVVRDVLDVLLSSGCSLQADSVTYLHCGDWRVLLFCSMSGDVWVILVRYGVKGGWVIDRLLLARLLVLGLGRLLLLGPDEKSVTEVMKFVIEHWLRFNARSRVVILDLVGSLYNVHSYSVMHYFISSDAALREVVSTISRALSGDTVLIVHGIKGLRLLYDLSSTLSGASLWVSSFPNTIYTVLARYQLSSDLLKSFDVFIDVGYVGESATKSMIKQVLVVTGFSELMKIYCAGMHLRDDVFRSVLQVLGLKYGCNLEKMYDNLLERLGVQIDDYTQVEFPVVKLREVLRSIGLNL
ncbi:MAG: hypothetical protein DRJ40_07930 [Thermoprotei archaeon]|nr:MAG: hypothetical protein DRJ40_07930 [Thermoprotei archaeon]